MAESPSNGDSGMIGENNELITSYTNPNYQLGVEDALNSNHNASTQYFNEVNTFESQQDQQNTKSGKRRKKYANMDLSSMGIEIGGAGDGDGRGNPPNKDINCGFTVCSPDSDSMGVSTGASSIVSSPGGDSKQSSDNLKSKSSEYSGEEEEEDEGEDLYAEIKSDRGFMDFYHSLEESVKRCQESANAAEESSGDDETTAMLATSQTQPQKEDSQDSLDEKARMINSPDSNDSGIQADDTHLRGPLNENIYATVDKTKKTNNVKKASTQEKASDEIDALPPPEAPPKLTDLPPGWEKHEDENGAYYWHIKSGTIQRDPPPPPPPETQRQTSNSSQSSNGSIPTTPGNGQNFLQEFEGHALKYAAESVKSLSKASTQESLSSTSSPEAEKKIRFAVRSLGWVRIAEEDLTPDKSSKAVNKCIVDLSLGRNDINDVVGRWGDGKDLYMELDNEHLTLFDPTDMTLLNRQPIQSIRVWGVGRDNGRDFAYVARDRSTRKHMCHVFRCDTPARQIANTLRDICKKIMLERSMQQQIAKQTESNTGAIQRMAVSRPNNLPNLEKAGEANGKKITFEQLYKNTSFPTPMEEPKKVLRCHYLGTAQVPKSTGVDVLNAALETVHRTVPEQNWVECNIGIAPSTITVCDCENEENILAECRVRFLSFMGIAMSNVKLGGFIMHSAEDQYVAHVFHCDPSAGALCKTIEAACKLRYQKCLDAHPTAGERHKQMQNQGQKAGLTASLKSGVQRGVSNVMGMFKKRGS